MNFILLVMFIVTIKEINQKEKVNMHLLYSSVRKVGLFNYQVVGSLLNCHNKLILWDYFILCGGLLEEIN